MTPAQEYAVAGLILAAAGFLFGPLCWTAGIIMFVVGFMKAT
jgi:hypothetical protein